MKRLITRVIGVLLLMIGLPVILLFPPLTAPRQSFGKDRPREEYLQIQLQEHKQRHELNLRVCIPAGIIVGIGITLLVFGFTGNKKKEE